MFVGHYAFGFYLKKKHTDVPLWLIFLGVQFVDLLWAVFMMFGIERAAFNPEATVFLRAVYEYYPYTHSLATGAIIAVLFGLLVYRFSSRRWAIVTGIAVISHWFLDVFVHIPDVPLLLNSYKVGFGLWNFPVATLLLEVTFLTVGLWYVLTAISDVRMKKWVIGLYLFLTIFYVASFFAPPVPPTALQIGIFGVVIYGGVPLVAYFAERKRGQTFSAGSAV